ncbi:MAG TPA: hypothetical protein PKH97_01095 [Tetrasphaera sp.]|uniref:DUF2530 domain-containing protein n=1 Tax=Nostocoides vanveenii TaxID=330835 RepID=A0ABP4X8D6_9MICO|nr:hypothetical protein [Tetrasphaera sp.]HNQ05761.1 hypothetical protein [Tetrasphaera sp.]
MNPNLKTFLAIFCFIWGVVGIVLAVANLQSTPADSTKAVLFGAVGMVGFVSGWLLMRRPAY